MSAIIALIGVAVTAFLLGLLAGMFLAVWGSEHMDNGDADSQARS